MDSLDQLNFDKIVLIGEYVTPEGPFVDDYFIFIVDSAGQEIHLSVEEPKTLEFLKRASLELDVDLNLQLNNKTDFTSRVMYPKHLQGKAIFEYKKIEKGIISRITVLGVHEYERFYSTSIHEYINSHRLH